MTCLLILAAAVAQHVDTHMHIGGMADRSGPRPGNAADEYNAAADTLVGLMDELGIEHSMVVVVTPHGRRTNDQERDLIAGAVRRHADRLHLMDGGATLAAIVDETPADRVTDAVRARFEREAEAILDADAVGFGEMIVLHPGLGPTHNFQQRAADHPLFLLLADIAAARGVPIDIHMEVAREDMATSENLRRACRENPARLAASLPGFERLLEHNRDARIVWQHIGWDNLGQATVELMRGMMERHPNLYLSLRVEARTNQVESREPMPNRIVDDRGNIRDEWMALVRDFEDRVMIGADEFVGASGSPQGTIRSLRETWTILDQFPDDLARRIGGDNARRVYGIGGTRNP